MRIAVSVLILLFVEAYSIPIDEKIPRFNIASDQEGRFHLIDLNTPEVEPEPSFDADNDMFFVLFTRRNPDAGQIISFDMDTVRNSNFNVANDVRFIVHGWAGSQHIGFNIFIKDSLLERADHNVIIVDWSAGAQVPNYITARNRVGAAGATIARFIIALTDAGLASRTRMNLIGHSLGSHVVGHAGKLVRNPPVEVIFATDPAGPLFSINNPSDRLDVNDAAYTEAFHTNVGVLGFDEPIAHATFYPNWGGAQPGCGTDIAGFCAHERSNLFYAESVNSDRFVARQCAGYSEIVTRNCPGTGTFGIMGGDARKALQGVFFLETNAEAPFAQG